MNSFIKSYIRNFIIAYIAISALENSVTKLSFYYQVVIAVVAISLVNMLIFIVKLFEE